MKKILNTLSVILLLLGLSFIAGAQFTTRSVTSVTKGIVVKGAPYSAEAVSENVRTLADGNKITRKTKSIMYRDSEGRTRVEIFFNSSRPPEITVIDPVAETAYMLDSKLKTARRLALISRNPVPPQAAPSGYSSRSESIGTQTLEGLEATGRRSVLTIAPGTIGNEKAIETISESWYSKDLGMIVLSKRIDPNTGEYTYRLTNIKRAEPDKSLFTVPADYKIVDAAKQSDDVPAQNSKPI